MTHSDRCWAVPALAGLLAGLAASVGPIVASAEPVVAAETTFSGDVVHARAAVPDEARKIGEAKLLTRGTTTVVQTALATRVVTRAAAEIRAKEEANWAEGSVGHADMRRYVAALEEAATTLRASLPLADARGVDDAERRIHLLIEFRADRDTAEVVIAAYDARDPSAPYDPVASRTLATPSVGRAYVLENMRLILADTFHVPKDDLAKLGPLGPLASP